MRLIPVIGFCGLAGSGKTTSAMMLVEMLCYERHRLADPLKNMLRVIGLTDRELDGDLKEVPSDTLCGRTPRYAMQELGTAFGRDLIHPEFWLRAWLRRVDESLAAGRNVVCDDIRFPNEAEAIRSRGGIIIRILSDRADVVTSSHISEHMPLQADKEIRNDLTKDALLKRVCAAAFAAEAEAAA